MSKKFGGLLAIIFIAGTINYSCAGRVPQGGFNPSKPPADKPTPEPPPSVDPKPPAVGSDVDLKFLETFNPAFAAGMKYTEVVTVTPGTKKDEVSKEITAVTADSLKVKIKTPQGISEKTFTIADFTNPTSEAGAKVKFKYAGKEDLKVMAGEFKGATKITLSDANGTFTGWFATGTGAVKKIFVDPKKLITTTELKEFKPK